MNWYVTYFYNTRHMKANQLPVSTAMWPPKFFAKSSKTSDIHFNDNHVMFGITAKELVPQEQCECPCEKKDYQHCCFLKKYKEQLDEVDFFDFIDKWTCFSNQFSKVAGTEITDIILLVYEKPGNHCSERTVLKKWFQEHGIELKEMEVIK